MLARSRISDGTRSRSTKWNWMFWRVVMRYQPREYIHEMWAIMSSCSAVMAP